MYGKFKNYLTDELSAIQEAGLFKMNGLSPLLRELLSLWETDKKY